MGLLVLIRARAHVDEGVRRSSGMTVLPDVSSGEEPCGHPETSSATEPQMTVDASLLQHLLDS